MKLPFIPLMAVAVGMTLCGTARAQNAPAPRGYRYFSPGVSVRLNSVNTANAQQSGTGLPGAAAAPRQVAPQSFSGARYVVGSSGIRYAVISGSRPSFFGQFVNSPGIQRPTSDGPQNRSALQIAQGPAPVSSYGAPSPQQPTAGSAPAAGVPMPASSGISSIYAYSGRAYGPYYANGVQYYNYGGSCGWGSPYNSAYYDTGCYRANACCRASRRLCTPFGGMAYGCEPGCYVVTPPTCPMVCDPYASSAAGSVIAPPTYAPPTRTQPPGGAKPQPMPPQPEPPTDTPPQPTIKPDPQASNQPRIPIYPRIPNLPET